MKKISENTGNPKNQYFTSYSNSQESRTIIRKFETDANKKFRKRVGLHLSLSMRWISFINCKSSTIFIYSILTNNLWLTLNRYEIIVALGNVFVIPFFITLHDKF